MSQAEHRKALHAAGNQASMHKFEFTAIHKKLLPHRLNSTSAMHRTPARQPFNVFVHKPCKQETLDV